MTLTVAEAAFEQARDLLYQHSVSFQEVVPTPSPLLLEEAQERTLVVYAETDVDLSALLGMLSDRGLPPPSVTPFDYDPGAWVEKWKQFYDWTSVSPRLAVGPAFKPCPFPAEQRVCIEPGQAFGTGTHESTQLALALVERYLSEGDRFCEPGCGSGILSIAAMKLGAREAIGFDYDRPACFEAVRNAHMNGVVCHFFRGGTGSISGTFDVVAANILGHLLVSIAADVRALVRPGGVLVLAGLVTENRPDFEELFFRASGEFERLELRALHEWWGGAWRRVP